MVKEVIGLLIVGQRKGKIDDDVNNLLVGATFCGEIQEDKDKEYPIKWLGDSGASSHITHKKKDMTDVEKCDINVTVVNFQKMKCKLKGSVKNETTRRTNGETYQNTVPSPSCEKLLSVSKLVYMGATTGVTQDKTIINKNGVSITLDARKGKN